METTEIILLVKSVRNLVEYTQKLLNGLDPSTKKALEEAFEELEATEQEWKDLL